jgi:Outer membrane protein and related peptidoglycan-associated (lipo)proteins
MRKIILILWLAAVSFTLVAQEKGLYLTLSGVVGKTSHGYTTDADERNVAKLGYGAGLGVQFFFTNHWGIGTGLGFACYQSHVLYKNTFVFENMTDDDPLNIGKPYDLTLGLNNWKETQKSYFLEIPLMAMYQKKWGFKEAFGMYFGAGVKLQLPFLSNKYEVKKKSELEVTGYYYDDDLTIDDLPDYGFGENNELTYKGDFKMKFGLSLSGELGILIKMGKRTDLTLGGYVDYALLNMQKNNVEPFLISPQDGANTIHPVQYVGDNLQYNGLLNSASVVKAKPWAVGAKVGLRIKLGKVTEKTEEEKEQAKKDKYPPIEVIIVRDSVVVQPVIIEVPQQQPVAQPMLAGVAGLDIPQEDEDILLEPIYFDLDKYDLRPESKEILDRKVVIMKKYPSAELIIFGHTCDLATESYNDKLGHNRAQAARYYLIRKGIKPSRISTISEGEHYPGTPNINEDHRQWNRKDEFFLGR